MTSSVGLARKCKAFREFLVPETWLLALVSVSFGVTGASLTAVEYALLLLAWGPFWTGATNLINMCFDREEDAINEAKHVSVDRERNVQTLGYSTILRSSLVLYTAAVIVLYTTFGTTVGTVATIATLGSIGYSVPPLRLKSHYLTSTSTLSLSAVVLPFLSGRTIHASLLNAPVGVLTFVGLGMAHALIGKEVPDYEGDRHAGHQTLVTAFGFRRGLRLFFLGYPVFYLAFGLAILLKKVPTRTAAVFTLIPVSIVIVHWFSGLQRTNGTACRQLFVLTFFHGLATVTVLYAAYLNAWVRFVVVAVGMVGFLGANHVVKRVLENLAPKTNTASPG